MYKILIVDDEQVEREGLQAILSKGFPSFSFMQAKNGAMAIEAARDFAPELILMDIKMPGMSGLEAVERIKAGQPRIKVVMVTAYDSFDFARQALKLGVKDYLLKPSKASEIIATIAGEIREIESERSAEEEQRKQKDTIRKMLPVVEADVVTQLLFDHVHEVHLDDMMRLLGRGMTHEAFVLLVTLGGGGSEEAFYAAVKDKMRITESGWAGAMSGRHIPLIVFRAAGISFRAQASQMVQQLLHLPFRHSGNEIFIGVGNPYELLDNIRLSYQEALISSSDTMLPSRHRFYCDLPVIDELNEALRSTLAENRLIDNIRLDRWDQVKSSVMELISVYESKGAPLVQAQQRVSEALWVASRVLLEMGIETEKPVFSMQVQEFRQLRAECDCLLEKLRNTAASHRNRMEPDVIHEIKQYIIAHSQEDISLESIAGQVNLSPYYISRMFKEQLGVNYIDFLTECRIEKAKKRMLNPKLSMKEIAYDVGYNDPNYFSKVFKKMCGVSPTDYRRAALGKKI
ncbi:response regulator [Paenibacillus tarimensis]